MRMGALGAMPLRPGVRRLVSMRPSICALA